MNYIPRLETLNDTRFFPLPAGLLEVLVPLMKSVSLVSPNSSVIILIQNVPHGKGKVTTVIQ